jgi:hypothetical protein
MSEPQRLLALERRTAIVAPYLAHHAYVAMVAALRDYGARRAARRRYGHGDIRPGIVALLGAVHGTRPRKAGGLR